MPGTIFWEQVRAGTEPAYECEACGQPLQSGEQVRYPDGTIVCRDCNSSYQEEMRVERAMERTLTPEAQE